MPDASAAHRRACKILHGSSPSDFFSGKLIQAGEVVRGAHWAADDRLRLHPDDVVKAPVTHGWLCRVFLSPNSSAHDFVPAALFEVTLPGPACAATRGTWVRFSRQLTGPLCQFEMCLRAAEIQSGPAAFMPRRDGGGQPSNRSPLTLASESPARVAAARGHCLPLPERKGPRWQSLAGLVRAPHLPTDGSG